MKALALPVLACLLLPVPAWAQNEGENQEKAEQEKANQERRTNQDRQKAVDDKGNPIDVAGQENADGTAGGVPANPSPREAMSSACSLQTMVSPPRLAPGETGTITLLLALQPHAVILAEAAWQLNYKPAQGKAGELQLGSHLVKPAPLGTIEERFKGKPVYDNQALVEIPVTVAAGTAHGKQHFEADLEVPLTDGVSGQQIGIFRTKAMHDIVIGPPMVRPVVLGPQAGASQGGASATGALGAQPTRGGAKSGDAAPPVKVGGVPSASEYAAPGTEAGAPKSASSGRDHLQQEGGAGADEEVGTNRGSMPTVPIAIGGGALILLVLLLASRRRR